MNVDNEKYTFKIKTVKEECAYMEDGKWPCKWISCNNAGQPPFVVAYRRIFTVDHDLSVTAHVSADERYDLFIDGVKIGRGSEYGDQNNWFYETYGLKFTKGRHTIVARTWSFGGMKPDAQVSVNHGFIFCPDEEENIALLGTGISNWEAKKIDGFEFVCDGRNSSVGPRLIIDGTKLPWNYENGEGSGWEKATIGYWGIEAELYYHIKENLHLLKPSILPAMKIEEIGAKKVVFVEKHELYNGTTDKAINYENNIVEECILWQQFLCGKPIIIPPYTARRAIIDLEEYYCIYPELVVSKGKGSAISISYSESLYDDTGYQNKSCRDEINGKYMMGYSDVFKPGGGRLCNFSTLWWRCGRFVQIDVCTGEEALTIDSLKFIETRYPMEAESSFQCNDVRLNEIIPILFRSIQMCSHETYMDCPYYEQLMYVGDTRLQMLVTFLWSKDSRLPKKAIKMFHESSLNHMRLVNCAYPSNNQKVIPSFCLCWINMIYDYAIWRDDYELINSMMPEARNTIERFLANINSDGLVKTPKGWNFYDWANDSDNIRYTDDLNWSYGEPRERGYGVNSIFNLHIILILTILSKLEVYVREPELSTRWERLAKGLYSAVVNYFWDDEKSMFSDDIDHVYYSEHAQALALLSGFAEGSKESGAVNALISKNDITRASIYFNHYVFEALVKTQHIEAVFSRLEPWFTLKDMGYRTTPEVFSPTTRSDCHGWGSHPIYHYLASILGIRPGTFAFKNVEIRPQLGPLYEVQGKVVHKSGNISVKYSKKENFLKAIITLPDGLYGKLHYNGKILNLSPGLNEYELY